MSEVQQKYTLYGLYEARGSEASASPWGECKNDGGLDRENDQTSLYWAIYEGYVPENYMSNSITVLTVNPVFSVFDIYGIYGVYGVYGIYGVYFHNNENNLNQQHQREKRIIVRSTNGR